MLSWRNLEELQVVESTMRLHEEMGYENVSQSEQCRIRIEELMQTNQDFKKKCDQTEKRKMRYLAEYIEKHDKERVAREEARKKRKLEDSSDGTPVVGDTGGASSSSGQVHVEGAFVDKRENVTSKDQDADEEMGIPLATEESVSNSVNVGG